MRSTPGWWWVCAAHSSALWTGGCALGWSESFCWSSWTMSSWWSEWLVMVGVVVVVVVVGVVRVGVVVVVEEECAQRAGVDFVDVVVRSRRYGRRRVQLFWQAESKRLSLVRCCG